MKTLISIAIIIAIISLFLGVIIAIIIIMAIIKFSGKDDHYDEGDLETALYENNILP